MIVSPLTATILPTHDFYKVIIHVPKHMHTSELHDTFLKVSPYFES